MNQKHSLNIANVFLFFDYHQKLLAVGNIIPRPALLHSYVSARLRLCTFASPNTFVRNEQCGDQKDPPIYERRDAANYRIPSFIISHKSVVCPNRYQVIAKQFVRRHQNDAKRFAKHQRYRGLSEPKKTKQKIICRN